MVIGFPATWERSAGFRVLKRPELHTCCGSSAVSTPRSWPTLTRCGIRGEDWVELNSDLTVQVGRNTALYANGSRRRRCRTLVPRAAAAGTGLASAAWSAVPGLGVAVALDQRVLEGACNRRSGKPEGIVRGGAVDGIHHQDAGAGGQGAGAHGIGNVEEGQPGCGAAVDDQPVGGRAVRAEKGVEPDRAVVPDVAHHRQRLVAGELRRVTRGRGEVDQS